MKTLNIIMRYIVVLLIFALQFIFIPSSQKVYAATSPTLNGVSGYSVLGGAAVTNTGSTTTAGEVGVSPGTSITGFPPGVANGNNATHVHSNDASAIAAQADALAAFNTLDQPCDQSFGAVDLTTTFPSGVGPGVYCSTSSFSLSGNLNLTGSGVWIFKTVSTLITSPGSSITGGDPCNIWWRIGSSTTLDTTTSFRGTVISQNGTNAINTSATLNGRFLGLSTATVTLDSNTITNPSCSSSSSSSSSGSSSNSDSGTSTSAPATRVCPALSCVTPIILESRRESPTSVFIYWGPYAGISTFTIRYGFENGNWLYSTNVTGFSTTINSLPPNQPIWVLISPTDGCSIGLCGEAMLVGGPGLPNTGSAPQKNIISWASTSIFALSSILLNFIYL